MATVIVDYSYATHDPKEIQKILDDVAELYERCIRKGVLKLPENLRAPRKEKKT